MKRRITAGGKANAVRGSKTPMRRPSAEVARHNHPADADLQEQLDQRTRERDEARKLHAEALEQQTATSEVLKVISSSPDDLQPVFQSMLENAVRICEAKFGVLHRYHNGLFDPTAAQNIPPALAEFQRQHGAIAPRPGTALDRIMRTKAVIHLADELTEQVPGNSARLGGARSLVGVPMLKGDELIGALIIYRQDVRPFTDKQIELVQNFAAQAVIAIENTRLLNELRQRTDDLTESLEQQTATSEVLRIVAKSSRLVQPVFDAIVANAVRLCDAAFSAVATFDGELLNLVAVNKMSPKEMAAYHKVFPRRPNRTFIMGRAFIDGKPVHVEDIEADPDYDPHTLSILKAAAPYRTYLGIPILRDGAPIGVIGCGRREVRPFTEAQISLVKSFAAQAVIAIENTRLLSELRQRTDDLSEALEQQTATSEVLKVVSSSPGDLQPVFQIMLENAIYTCGAKFGVLFLYEGDAFRFVAEHDAPKAWLEARRRDPIAPRDAARALYRVANTKQVAHIADLAAESPDEPIAKIGGARTVLIVPMLKNDELVGVFAIFRLDVSPFTEKQIALVSNFAAQAVIAIENTRLLNELRESLQQQTATADVLKVISRSTFDLNAVLGALVESACRLCEADIGNIARPTIDGAFRIEGCYGMSPELIAAIERNPLRAGRGSAIGRALLERATIHIQDAEADPDYELVEARRLGAFRSMLGVPLLREGNPIGVFALARRTVRPFTERQIELVQTFADQAAIAIENVRLFESVEARTRELAKSLDDLRTTQDRLVQTEKLASLGQLTAGIAHEIKNPLNFINNFSAVSVELIDELREALSSAHLDSKLRGEIGEIADMLQGNLDKVVQHGKRADSIVKNMLLHSRQGSGEHRPIDINTLVEESLNLAYHGARAEKQGFNITLETSFDPDAGEVDVFPQEITRVLLNLISNGFYAATKRKAETGDGGYEPTLAAATKDLGDRVEIRIRDNGTGIPPEVQEKMFKPFFTTKPAGEGTGLGLSISHDIIVKQHGGSIEVDTQPGGFTEFRIVLPRGAATIAK